MSGRYKKRQLLLLLVCMPGESFDAIELDCTVVALQGTIELQMNQDLCLK